MSSNPYLRNLNSKVHKKRKKLTKFQKQILS
jgi:hypothetical protein